jgi:phosphotriesterase-related protein
MHENGADDSNRPWAMSVTGPVPVDELGIVLPHEHMLIQLQKFVEFDEPALRARQEEPVALANLGWIRQYWTYNEDNLRLADEDLASVELARFRVAGGSTVVDLTLPGVGRDPEALSRISRATGVHIIMGCGAYVAHLQPTRVREASATELAEQFMAELQDGADDTGIRPGIIGEIGCSWPLDQSEAKAVRAAAMAQRQSGVPISIHPGRNREAPGAIVELLAESGADLSHVVIGHLDRTIQELDGLCELGRWGVYLELDCFGLETSFYPVPGIVDIDVLSDAQRLDLVRGLIDGGFGAQVLLSHDVCSKHRLARYGGHGYDHLLANVMPWMRQRGFTEEEIQMLFVRNPAAMLAIRSADRA